MIRVSPGCSSPRRCLRWLPWQGLVRLKPVATTRGHSHAQWMANPTCRDGGRWPRSRRCNDRGVSKIKSS